MVVMQVNVEGFDKYYAELSPATRLLFGTLNFFDIYHAWYFNFLLLVLSLNLPPNHQPSEDEGVFLYIAHRIAAGGMPYRDVWDHKPPGVYLLARHGGAARKMRIPFGPFLALGSVVALFAGPWLLHQYWSLFTGQ